MYMYTIQTMHRLPVGKTGEGMMLICTQDIVLSNISLGKPRKKYSLFMSKYS
jgi:hypothetical protein